MTRITEDEFVRQFEPEAYENGDLYRQFDWTDASDKVEIDKAKVDRRLWTAVEADGNWVLLSGYHWVNRLYHVICGIPYEEGADFEVHDDYTTNLDE